MLADPKPTKTAIGHLYRITATLSRRCRIFVAAAVALHTSVAADDACSTTALYAYADVTASDGITYSVETFYRSKDRAASKFIREDGSSLHVVEGPLTWVQVGNKAELAGNQQRGYALGHQFHALMIHFRDIVNDIEPVSEIEFSGRKTSALKGMRDTGGAVYLIDGETLGQPAGMRYDVGDLQIDIVASDWRDVGGTAIPFALLIDDGTRTFDYRYRTVDTSDKPMMWYYDSVASPNLDEIDILRLHRQLLVAHCMGDAAMMASLTAPVATIANRGSVGDTNPEEMAARFARVFDRRKYSAYIDTQYPRVSVAQSGDIGWAIVQVNTKGITEPTGAPFDEHWAWVMMAKMIDGRWLMAGNASNIKP